MAALIAALLATPVRGQRGGRGGVAMGGARGGIGQRGGFMGAPRGPYGGGGGFHGVYGRGFNGFPPHPSHPIHYPYYKWRYPWNWCPWAWGWYGVAGVACYSYPADSDPVYDAPPDNSGAYATYAQQQEIDRLKDEVARLTAEQPVAAPANPAPQPSEEQIADTLLVFRNRRSEAIQNYAMVGETLWVFAGQRGRKIPIGSGCIRHHQGQRSPRHRRPVARPLNGFRSVPGLAKYGTPGVLSTTWDYPREMRPRDEKSCSDCGCRWRDGDAVCLWQPQQQSRRCCVSGDNECAARIDAAVHGHRNQ